MTPVPSQILLEVVKMETKEPRTAQGSTGELGMTCQALHARLEDVEQDDGAGDLGRGKAATARPGGTRGQGHLLPTPPGPEMLCRCSVILVHPGEHHRRRFHQSSGLLRSSPPFSPLASPRHVVVALDPDVPSHSHAQGQGQSRKPCWCRTQCNGPAGASQDKERRR